MVYSTKMRRDFLLRAMKNALERLIVGGFSLRELGMEAQQSLWLRGGLPLSYLAATEADSIAWRKSFVQTFLERDLPQWGVRVSAAALLRFWSVVAHYHGQTWNGAEAARALGVSEATARRHLDLLTDGYMIRQLMPFRANMRKRQVKSPKLYVRDTGLLHQLLGVDSHKSLLTHPKVGASWEGFVVEQVLQSEPHDEVFFWATHQGAEIDLVLRRGDQLLGIECKRTDTPRLTRSIGIAIEDLQLKRVAIIYPGEKRFPLSEDVTAVPVAALAEAGSVFDA